MTSGEVYNKNGNGICYSNDKRLFFIFFVERFYMYSYGYEN